MGNNGELRTFVSSVPCPRGGPGRAGLAKRRAVSAGHPAIEATLDLRLTFRPGISDGGAATVVTAVG